MKIALDTNIIVYAEGADDATRQARALRVLSGVPRERFSISIQVLGELFNVLVRRGMPRDQARDKVLFWRQTLAIVDSTPVLMDAAFDLAQRHKLRIWDALILAAAAEARCELLLSEDFQDGFSWRGVMVANPFAAKPHPKLASLLRA
jgi:predicted nucleic acid-binding protein